MEPRGEFASDGWGNALQDSRITRQRRALEILVSPLGAGLILLVASCAGLIIVRTAPWIQVPVNEDCALVAKCEQVDGFRDVGYGELRSQSVTRFQREILQTPHIGLIGILFLGAFLVAHQAIPPVRSVLSQGQAILIGAGLTFAGTMVANPAAYWIGFFLARLLDDGPLIVKLHVVPIFLFAAGMLSIVLGWFLLDFRFRSDAQRSNPWEGHRPAVFALIVASLGLVLSPLIPYATARGNVGNFFYDPMTVQILGETTQAAPASAIESLEFSTWLGMIIAVASLIAPHLGASSSSAPQTAGRFSNLTFGLLSMPILGLGFYSWVLYRELPTLPLRPSIGPNVTWPILFAALGSALGLRLYRSVRTAPCWSRT